MRNSPRVLAAIALVIVAQPVLGQANLERGRKVYEECIVCHKLQPGADDLGPSLAGIVGRKAGTVEGFRFSPAMKKSGLTWDRATLAQFLADPQKAVRGNRMPYSGVGDPADLAALLDYIEAASR